MLPRRLHGTLALLVGAALLAQLALLLTGGTDASTGDSQADGPVGTRLVRLFSYFTIQSNLIVLAASITLAVAPRRDGRVWRVLRLDSLLGIGVTGIVYNTLLAGLVHLEGIALWTNAALHIVSPLATLTVWVLVGPRPRITWAVVGWAFAWPVAWIAWTFVHGAVTGWYPYPFLDVTTLGYPRALTGTFLVLVLGLLLALAFKVLDRRLPARNR